MNEILSLLIAVLGIIITILLIVGVHELGHFLAARACGIKVVRFSIGFGKTLFRWFDKKGTEYIFAAIPLGGYVQMVDEAEGDVSPADVPFAFNRQPFYKKFIVVACGPLSNLIFAFIIYWGLFIVGFTSVIPIIGKVAPQSIAAQAGMKPQQEIVSVNNEQTQSWMPVLIKILAHTGNQDQLLMQTKHITTQKENNYVLDLTNWKMDDLRPDPLMSLGITPYSPTIPPVIGKIVLAQSQLKTGDKILAVDAKPVQDWIGMQEIIVKNPDKNLSFTVLRQNKKITLVVPVLSKRSLFTKYGYVGIAPEFEWPQNLFREYKYDPLTALTFAWYNLKDFTLLNFIMIGKMITGKISLQSLGGPITIFESAGTALNQGLVAFFGFLAFLSISIGIINILPIPGLDGGHLLMQTIELMIGRPLSQRVQLLILRMGLIVLFLLITQALVNDILRI